MKLTYVRKTGLKKDEIIKNLKSRANKQSFVVIGEADIKNGIVLFITNPSWIQKAIAIDEQLIALIPSQVALYQKGKDNYIAVTNPSILKGISPSHEVVHLADDIEKELKELVHGSAGLADLKPEKVVVYSTMSCPYCKMEEAWLKEKHIEHEVKYVDLNPDAGRRIVEKTGQMGVPVTEILYEGEESEYVIGFDKPRLAQALGVAS